MESARLDGKRVVARFFLFSLKLDGSTKGASSERVSRADEKPAAFIDVCIYTQREREREREPELGEQCRWRMKNWLSIAGLRHYCTRHERDKSRGKRRLMNEATRKQRLRGA